ncbi:cation:proton antiporter [Jatrophihabitans sp. DSM 45814]
MDATNLHSLVVVLAMAALAPIIADLLKGRLAVPTVVLELVLGILVGPTVFGWVKDSNALTGLSDLGLALLMFLAGYEIDFQRIRGAPITLAVRSWLVTLLAGFAVAAIVSLITGNLGPHSVALGLVLTTTAVGTLLPILRDRGELETAFGPYVFASGAVGEFGPIVGISIFLATDRPLHSTVVLVVYVLVAVATVGLALRSRTPRVVRVIGETLSTSAQFGVRVACLLCVLLVWIATAFDLDYLLGAFTGGMILRLFLSLSPASEVEILESKLEAVGFGFLIPVFFVMSGVRLDLDALFDQPLYLLLLPVALMLYLVVRGGPIRWLYRGKLAARDVKALAVYSSTALPLVVVITGIGVTDDLMQPALASVLVTAAMLSVLILPFWANQLRGSSRATETVEGS